jgi:nucleoside 2-deoxyribosyltransferase
MGVDDEVSADSNGTKELSPEQARIKREHFLALAKQQAKLDDSDCDEVDSADSTMATLILPGG